MKAKLTKNGGHYFLFDGNRFISTTDCSEGTPNKLSLKNCQSIECGYDLDEIWEELFFKRVTNTSIRCFDSFKLGFQKSLEILGDKKFSEEDMGEAIQFGLDAMYGYKQGKDGHTEVQKKKYIQSLQQTEWDVLVEMECVIGCQNLILNGENSVCCGDKKPKIADGCLILKRIDDE